MNISSEQRALFWRIALLVTLPVFAPACGTTKSNPVGIPGGDDATAPATPRSDASFPPFAAPDASGLPDAGGITTPVDDSGALDADFAADSQTVVFSDSGVPDGSGLVCVSSVCICPAYETLCNGACIVTNLDPNNCGACGHACPAGQACSAGVCSPGCTMPTVGGTIQIVKCGRVCADVWADNKNCGTCGNDCTAKGQVCVSGGCSAPKFSFDAGTVSCPNGGPLIDVSNGANKTCVGTLAQTTFRFGMCACGDVSLVNSGQAWGAAHPGLNFPALYIDAYDSSKGPWDPNQPGLGGSLGVNGAFRSTGGAFTFVTGHMWDSSTINSGGLTDVKQELHAVGPITATDAFNVGQPNSTNPRVPVVPGTVAWDGYVLGNITAPAAAPMTFYKDLFVPAAGTTRTNVVVRGGVQNNTPFIVPPPCDACGAATVPVGTIVDQYAAPANNDNASIGLAPAALTGLTGATRLDLPCGYYYVDSINSTGSVTVYAHGHTALFIGGDASAFALTFSLDPGGSLDVFIKGTIITTSDLIVGNPNYAALTRVYVGSPGITLSGEAHFAGLFYAAGSDISLQSHITAYGALFVKNFVGQGDNTDIHYDRAALSQSYGCDITPRGCKSCIDCANQACVNGSCAACATSAQCCPPLVCNAGACQ